MNAHIKTRASLTPAIETTLPPVVFNVLFIERQGAFDMDDLRKWIAGGVVGFFVAGYLLIGVATAFLSGLIVETSTNVSEFVWWGNPAVCVFAWPLVWIAAYAFAKAHS